MMTERNHDEDDLRDLSKLSAEELARRLRDHFAAVGGLACAGEVEIAREAVRRARRAEGKPLAAAAKRRWAAACSWRRPRGRIAGGSLPVDGHAA
jgi:hypothetical protein